MTVELRQVPPAQRVRDAVGGILIDGAVAVLERARVLPVEIQDVGGTGVDDGRQRVEAEGDVDLALSGIETIGGGKEESVVVVRGHVVRVELQGALETGLGVLPL